jgi:hypothetical protein
MVEAIRRTSVRGRVRSIDLRIGMNLLGDQGLDLLMQYIRTKSQQRDSMPVGSNETLPNASLHNTQEKEAQLWQTRSSVATYRHITTI